MSIPVFRPDDVLEVYFGKSPLDSYVKVNGQMLPVSMVRFTIDADHGMDVWLRVAGCDVAPIHVRARVLSSRQAEEGNADESDVFRPLEPGEIRLGATLAFDGEPTYVIVPAAWYQAEKRAGLDTEQILRHWLHLSELAAARKEEHHEG